MARLARANRLTSRFHEELSDAEVYAFNATAIRQGLAQRFAKRDNPYGEYLRVGSRFGRNVRAALRKRKDQHWENTVFFGYDTGFFEAAAWAKNRGAACVVGQMDPARTEVEMVREEEKLWPGWAKKPLIVPEEYFLWRQSEWALADIVMVNSRWTHDALLKQGVPASKLAIVPLAYEVDETKVLEPIPLKEVNDPLRVLFLGQVNIRKGIPYLIEAARLLKGAPVQFDIVGPISIADQFVVSSPSNVRFHGSVTRDKVQNFYSQADVFVLPTISDGFALTQLEAMSYGLPVITTPNCGDVVTDGVDGFLVPARNAPALAEALLKLAEDPERLQAMRVSARERVTAFSLDQLDKDLRQLEARLPLRRNEADLSAL
jgi:glycosyltransferase involved in cell wall biosynthesis